jgi:hypothetical protein
MTLQAVGGIKVWDGTSWTACEGDACGDFEYEVFTSGGTWGWAAAGSPAWVEVLLVAGGGGGGAFLGFANGSGAGGAGGVRALSSAAVSGDVTVTVGAGGAGGTTGQGADGGTSSFGASSVTGGGGGQGYTGSVYQPSGGGRAGGSGGGAVGI